ncbi:Pumilio domain containing protein C4G8.03C [Entamoeba marina]
MSNATQDIVQRLVFTESRSTSAPPGIADKAGSSGEVLSLEELEQQAFRAHPDYHNYYFQQKPPDPRLPKPLFIWEFTKCSTHEKSSMTQEQVIVDSNYEDVEEEEVEEEEDVEEEDEYEESYEDEYSDEDDEYSGEDEYSDEDDEYSDEDRGYPTYQPTYPMNPMYPVGYSFQPFGYSYPQSVDYVSLSKEHHGSRGVQQTIENGPAEKREEIWESLKNYVVELSSDLFANYVIQKVLEFIPESRRDIPKKMRGYVLKLTLHMYGCRVVQKAMEYAPDNDRRLMFDELRGNLVRCIEDQNGNHVIQKCVEKGDKQMYWDCCKHPYGCRVVQRVIECVDYKYVEDLLKKIEPHSLSLTEDQYGNYVIQNILERKFPNGHRNILVRIRGNIVRLSMGKYSSNVIEKCFKFANSTERAEILNEIYKDNGLLQMMQDQFANYVVQKIVEAVDRDERSKIVELFIRPNLASLKKVIYTKHILSLLESLDNIHL